MVQTHNPKFNWGAISEKNSGHTENEWGMAKNPKSQRIVAYTVSWNK
ncbi:MAG: hypothetical protein QXE82_06220 [Candidatus Nitrosotenuis sp.]